jgi:integrase
MHLRFITLFFNYLFKLRLIEVKLPVVFYKGPPDIPRAPQKDLDEKEIKKMIQGKGKLSLPEKVILELLISRPLRIGELTNLRVSDVNLTQKIITIYKSKNQKTRILSIPSVTYDGLSQLIENKNSEDLVFGFAERTMYGVLNRIYKKLGIEKRGRSGHAFRHWVIMSMLYKLRRDVSVVAEDAGNSKKTIMSHYTERIPSEELRDTEKSMDRLLSPNMIY